jgi:Double-GTPase 2
MTAPQRTAPPCRCPSCFLILLGTALVETCPRCGEPVPAGWQRGPTTCIVMAGARFTGKSIYIGVMIKQLEQFAAHVGMDVVPATPSTRAVFRDRYEQPLYEQRGIVPPTPSVSTADYYQREPLAFTLTNRAGAVHHLVIRDVAGEDLENLDPARAAELEFFRNADVVLFLFDPLQIAPIRTKLRDFVPLQAFGAHPRSVLAAVQQLTGPDGPRLGVILSKFDAVQILRDVEGGGEWSDIMRNPGAAFFRDPGPLAVPDPYDADRLHEEIRSLLLKLDVAPFVAAAERHGGGGRHRFFAVSALGESPDGQDLSVRGIAPFRCLDPLRWALTDPAILG